MQNYVRKWGLQRGLGPKLSTQRVEWECFGEELPEFWWSHGPHHIYWAPQTISHDIFRDGSFLVEITRKWGTCCSRICASWHRCLVGQRSGLHGLTVLDGLCGSSLHYRHPHHHHRHLSNTKYDTYTSLLTVNLRSSSDSGAIHLTGRRPYSNKIFHWTDVTSNGCRPACIYVLVISINLISLFVVVACWVFIRFTSYYLYKLLIFDSETHDL